jgi:hypothetical protein
MRRVNAVQLERDVMYTAYSLKWGPKVKDHLIDSLLITFFAEYERRVSASRRANALPLPAVDKQEESLLVQLAVLANCFFCALPNAVCVLLIPWIADSLLDSKG